MKNFEDGLKEMKLEKERQLIDLIAELSLKPYLYTVYQTLSVEDKQFVKSMGIEIADDHEVLYNEDAHELICNHFQS